MKKQFGIAMIALSAAMALTFTACGDDSSSGNNEPKIVDKVDDLSEDCEDGDEALVGTDKIQYTCTDGKWATEAKSSSSKVTSSSEEEECNPDLENCDEEKDENKEEEVEEEETKPSKGDSGSGSGSGGSGSGSGSGEGGSGSGSEEPETPSTPFKVNISATTVEYGETVDFTAEGASNCRIYVYAADDVGGASESDFEVTGATKVSPSDYYDSPTCALTVKNVSTKTEDKKIVVRVDSYEKSGEEIVPETEDASVTVTLQPAASTTQSLTVSRTYIYINGDSTTTTVELPGNTGCEFVIKTGEEKLEQDGIIHVYNMSGSSIIADPYDATSGNYTANECKISIKNLKTTNDIGSTTINVSVQFSNELDKGASSISPINITVRGADFGRISKFQFLDTYVNWREVKESPISRITHGYTKVSGKAETVINAAKVQGFSCTTDESDNTLTTCTMADSKKSYTILVKSRKNQTDEITVRDSRTLVPITTK